MAGKSAAQQTPLSEEELKKATGGQQVATRSASGALSAADFDDAALAQIKEDAGKGTSTLARDNIVPMIYVLQALSPQVNKRNPNFLEGAEAGAIWLRNSSMPIVSGDVGFAFQPCHYSRDIVEWIDRDSGGGFVARHPFASPDESMEEAVKRLRGDVRPSKKEGSKRIEYWLGNHELKETRYHAGFVHGGYFALENFPGLMMPYMLPLSGSGHQVSREWMFMMNQHTFPGQPDKVLAPWSRLYHLKTRPRTNSAGQEWSMFTVTDDIGWVPGFPKDLGVYNRGKQLFESFERGEKQAEAPIADTDGDGGSREERAREAGV